MKPITCSDTIFQFNLTILSLQDGGWEINKFVSLRSFVTPGSTAQSPQQTIASHITGVLLHWLEACGPLFSHQCSKIWNTRCHHVKIPWARFSQQLDTGWLNDAQLEQIKGINLNKDNGDLSNLDVRLNTNVRVVSCFRSSQLQRTGWNLCWYQPSKFRATCWYEPARHDRNSMMVAFITSSPTT